MKCKTHKGLLNHVESPSLRVTKILMVPGSTRYTRRLTPTTRPVDEQTICPKCLKTFKNIKILESHDNILYPHENYIQVSTNTPGIAH